MQPISDKNLDKLFQSRFENLEAEPSKDLWFKIDAELEGTNKKKSSKSVIWMSAASVLILLSATLYLYKPTEVIRLKVQSDKLEVVAKTENPVKENVKTENQDADLNYSKPEKSYKNTVYQVANYKPEVEKSYSQNIGKVATKEVVTAEKSVPVKIAEPVLSQPLIVENTMIAQVDPEKVVETEDESPKQKVRGIGGLVNFVIAQVDKRDDKLIEFKNSDEGAEISGINLGLVKFKSRNK